MSNGCSFDENRSQSNKCRMPLFENRQLQVWVKSKSIFSICIIAALLRHMSPFTHQNGIVVKSAWNVSIFLHIRELQRLLFSHRFPRNLGLSKKSSCHHDPWAIWTESKKESTCVTKMGSHTQTSIYLERYSDKSRFALQHVRKMTFSDRDTVGLFHKRLAGLHFQTKYFTKHEGAHE